MTDFHNIERTLTDLEGASHALNNVVQSPDITTEVSILVVTAKAEQMPRT